MKPIYVALVVMLASFAAGIARAEVRDCTQAEYQEADSAAAWRDVGDNAEFNVPEIVYNRPRTSSLGLELVFIVSTDGRIVCMVGSEGYARKALNETAERYALLDAMQTWRFKPFLDDKGKPVQVLTLVMVPEKIDFHYHEDMPAAPASTAAIKLSRSGCYGWCPDYTVTLHGNGWVEFSGNFYTNVTGTHVYTVSPGDVAALVERLRADDIWSMAGNWVGNGSDAPRYSLDITIGGQTRHFEDYFGRQLGMPQALSDAMDDIDRASRTDNWIHLSSYAVAHLENDGFPFRSQAGADLLFKALNDDEVHDDAALLRLIELGAPLSGGRYGKYEYKAPRNGLLNAALLNHHVGLVDPLISRGFLTTAGRPDQTKIDAAFQDAVRGGRLAPVQRIWEIAGSRPHPLLTYADSDDDGKHKQRSPVVLLLQRQEGDDHWEGLAIAQWLAAQGNDLKAIGANGDNLLDTAVNADDIPMAKFLIAQGLDPSRPGQYGENALGGVDDDENMAMVLVDAGANPWALETKTYSFVDFAKSKGWTRVLAWMEAHKSK